MRERAISHITLTLGTSFGIYLTLNPPYGFTFERFGGIFLILFLLWATKTNFESELNDVSRGN